jgi:replicative DNA helicase
MSQNNQNNQNNQNITHLLEQEIIKNLLNNKHYFNSSIHHLEKKHFTNPGMSLIFNQIKNHYLNYGGTPNLKEIIVSFKDSASKDKTLVKDAILEIKEAKENVNEQQLMELTEKFIKTSIFSDAIILGAEALGSHNEDKMSKSFTLAEEAVKVSLDSDLGIGLEEIDKIFEDFKDKPGLLTGIKSWDQMLGTGFRDKTLSAIAAASGVGKSAAMVDFAVRFLLQGKDVVILSLEMAESEFYKRLYSNLYDIDIAQIPSMEKQVLKMKYNQVKDKIGKLVIKEFPAGGLTPLGIDGYLSKLNNEKGIERPVVFVDYLGLLSSDRIKSMENQYAYYGSISEELRAVAQKRSITMITALQMNRSSINNLEVDQSALSESMKIMMTLDFMAIIAQTPEMKEQGKMKINIVKNRFSGKTWSFDIGFNYHHFRFVDKFHIGGENISSQALTNSLTGSNPTVDLSGLMAM